MILWFIFAYHFSSCFPACSCWTTTENTPPKKIFFVKLWRITIAFVIWSTFYSIIELVEQIHRHTFNPRDFMHNLIIGQYHMWFIYMLAGLYIATPVLRLIAQNETICKYFMVLAFCCIFLGNCIFNLPFIGGTLLVAFHRLDLNVISGFSLYFLLGHWLANHKLNNKQRKLIYALGIFSLIFTIGFNLEYSIYRQNAHEWIFNYLYPNILFITIAFFVFGQYNFSKIKFSEKQCQFISLTAKLSFGIYLVHVLFLEHLYLVGLPHFFIHPWLSIPITACLTFILSFAASYLLNKIPILNKYIV